MWGNRAESRLRRDFHVVEDELGLGMGSPTSRIASTEPIGRLENFSEFLPRYHQWPRIQARPVSRRNTPFPSVRSQSAKVWRSS